MIYKFKASKTKTLSFNHGIKWVYIEKYKNPRPADINIGSLYNVREEYNPSEYI